MNETPRPLLTALLPTHNRPQQVVAQLRLLYAAGFPYPLVVADSSDAIDAELCATAAGFASYRTFPAEMNYYDKMVAVLAEVRTPFVLTMSDKKATFPHAITPLLNYLQGHPAYAAAVGYVLRFARDAGDVDIYRVQFFTPSIAEDEPLRRLYHLMRRYQVSGFGVFRTEAYGHCAAAAAKVKGKLFQEIMFMSALALHGKIARLPLIFNLHGPEESFSPADERHPLYWFAHDPQSFFHHYTAYREAVARLVHDGGAGVADDADLRRLLDLIHATYFGRECDTGVFNHAAELLLGGAKPSLGPSPDWPGPRPVADGDLVHAARDGSRRYLWRRGVLEAEPRDEITIAPAEIEAVERALEIFLE